MPVTQVRMTFAAMVVTILVQSGLLHAQISLDIEGVDLALGMDRQAVLAKLKSYRLDCPGEQAKSVAECNSLLVQSDRPPYDAYANIVFENGKIKSLRKYWSRGYEGTEPGKFVQTLYSLLSNHGRQGATEFKVSVSERRDPGVIQQTIFLTSGRKTISISYAEGLRGGDGKTIPPFVGLDEMVE